MLLSNRAVLITGGKRIGAALALALARGGADVALSFNQSREAAEEVAGEIRGAGRRAFIYRADLSQGPEAARLVERAAVDLGRLDILVHMASVYRARPLDQTDLAAWDEVVNVDLRSAFLCAVAAVPHMRAAGGGRIITFSDWVAASGRPRYRGYLPYYVAKRGVIGLTEALALELASDQILVNTIAPGPILPPEGTSEQEFHAVVGATPLGRWGGAAEVIRAVLFLIESEFITGETIRVDGGRHLK